MSRSRPWPHNQALAAVFALAGMLSASACTELGGSAATDDPATGGSGVSSREAEPPPAEASDASTTVAPRSCVGLVLAAGQDLPADPARAAVAAVAPVFECATTLYVAADDTAIATAAQLALEDNAPLVVDPQQAVTAAEIARLAPDDIILVIEADTQTTTAQTAMLERSGATVAVVAPEPGVGPNAVLADLADNRSQPTDADTGLTWLVDPQAAAAGLAAAPAIIAGGGTIVVTEPTPTTSRTTTEAAGSWFTVGDHDPTERWSLLRPYVSAELPGGGTEVFPGRRVVAFYGSPVTFRLGLLGEQGPQATIDRIAPLLDEYQIEGGDPVIAGFELIATVADSKPGDDGDYSNELTPDEMREWIEVATANDAYIIIDLQPGRTDFVTQAKRYEEFLRLPNVGLALDPEWRLEPDEVHLRQIGSVDAAEVNLVVDYLATIVRDEQLPQKMLVLHQFQEQMLPDRDQILTPPELAVVVHVDGQGPLGSKYGTYESMLEVPVGPDQQLWWGWKNFIDEDTPTATPGQVNQVEPLPVVVTYQ